MLLLAVALSDDDIRQVALQCFANLVKVLKIDTLCDFMVEFIDGRRPYAGFPREVSLRPPPLAKPGGQ